MEEADLTLLFLKGLMKPEFDQIRDSIFNRDSPSSELKFEKTKLDVVNWAKRKGLAEISWHGKSQRTYMANPHNGKRKRSSDKKNSPCRYFFRKGKCLKGDDCDWSHDPKHKKNKRGKPTMRCDFCQKTNHTEDRCFAKKKKESLDQANVANAFFARLEKALRSFSKAFQKLSRRSLKAL